MLFAMVMAYSCNVPLSNSYIQIPEFTFTEKANITDEILDSVSNEQYAFANGFDISLNLQYKQLDSFTLSTEPSPTRVPIKATSREKVGYYKMTFNIQKIGDTFFDMSSWGKGVVWINGHCIGRFWNIDPQQTIYCPAKWLKSGQNEIIVLDIIGPDDAKTTGLLTPFVVNQKR